MYMSLSGVNVGGDSNGPGWGQGLANKEASLLLNHWWKRVENFVRVAD